MIKNNIQKGNAHTIFIILLTIVLLGILGFVFWQNFNKNEPIDDEKLVFKAEATPKLLAVSLNKGFMVDIAINYPENWTLERSVNGSFPINLENGATSETLKINSPSKKYYVKYSVGSSAGLGGMCIEDEAGVIEQIGFDRSGLEGTSFAKTIVTNQNGQFLYYAGLLDKKVEGDSKPSDSTCELFSTNLTHLADSEDGTPIYLFEASIHIEGLNDPAKFISGEGTTNSDEIENAFKNKEYEQAKAIVISTKRI